MTGTHSYNPVFWLLLVLIRSGVNECTHLAALKRADVSLLATAIATWDRRGWEVPYKQTETQGKGDLLFLPAGFYRLLIHLLLTNIVTSTA